MNFIIFICVGFSVFEWSDSTPVGVGAYSVQDSSGNRYEGTFHIKDGQAINDKGEPIAIPQIPFPDFDNFFPDFFRNFENSLDEVFDENFESQQKAFDAARRAYEVTSLETGFIPDMVPRWGGPRGGLGQNSAVAAGFVSPTNTRQVAAINPANPNMQNVDVSKSYKPQSGPGIYSVSSRSSSSSKNIGGIEQSNRSAKTVVNRNGEISTYEVNN